MADQIERQIPATCPSCGHTIATGYRNHCGPDKWCGWILCDGCDAVVDTRTGRYTTAGRRAA